MAETTKKTTRKPKTTTTTETAKRSAKRATKNVEVMPAPEAVVMMPVTNAEIAALAHSFWMERGCQHGGHHDDWFRAEQALRGQAA